MIEIKNKRMVLFREDRLIGAKGDVDTSERKFILDAVQGECDLRELVAWIKIDPKFPGESPYDQAIKKEHIGDKIVLTWKFSAKNLQRAGEISAQIIFASPAYFLEDELGKFFEDTPFIPNPIAGISAPVWQSYPEIFVVEESIDDTEGYKELGKNVIVSAVAEVISSAESAETSANSAEAAAENAETSAQNAQEAADDAQAAAERAQEAADSAHTFEMTALSISNDIENKSGIIEQNCNEIRDAKQKVQEDLEVCQECVELVDGMQHQVYNYMEMAQESSKMAEQSAQDAHNTIKKISGFRHIYTKILTVEDSDCYSFEITKDADGNPFSLSEFAVFMHFPMMPDMGLSYIRVNILPNDNSITTYQRICQFSALSDTKDTYLRSEHKNMGRWVTKVISGNAWNQNAETLRINGTVASAYRDTDGMNAVAIRISQHTDVGAPFPEGTEIEIWGVDSIEEAE